MALSRSQRARDLEAFVIRAAIPIALVMVFAVIGLPIMAWRAGQSITDTIVATLGLAIMTAATALLARASLQSSANARNFFDATPDIQLEFTLDGGGERRLAGWNRAAEAFGHLDLRLGAPLAEVLGSISTVGEATIAKRAHQSGLPVDMIVEVEIDGKRRMFDTLYIPVRPDGKRIRRALLSARDVTEMKLADEVLKESEASYRRLAETMNDLVLAVDLQQKITFANQAAFLILGYRPDELQGTFVYDLVHPDDRERVRQAQAGWTAGTASAPLRHRARRKDGAYRWIESRPSVVIDPVTGDILSFQDVARDVTAQVELESELQAARLQAEAAARAKAEFLANMSHELRTPLTSIIGFSELLLAATDVGDEPRRHATRITDASRALLDIINDVLDFSKLDAGQVELEQHPFSIRDLVEQTVGIVALQAAAKGLAVQVEVDEALPDALMGDRAKLRQVLVNLLGNAVKFTTVGRVQVSVSYDAARNPPRLAVTVSDTGAGIPADRVGHLFQRFTQADSSISRRFGGTGLGLSICRGLVELMGGKIGVESRFGEGSTFRFEIPAETAASADCVQAPPPVEHDALRPARILLVDDTAVNRELVSALLAPFGFEVEEAAGGQEAIDAALSRDFDLILMDVRMPGVDGLAATRAIRAAAKDSRRIPILALTADIMASNVQACADAGMDDHIGKPIAPTELIAKIATWLRADFSGETGPDLLTLSA